MTNTSERFTTRYVLHNGGAEITGYDKVKKALAKAAKDGNDTFTVRSKKLPGGKSGISYNVYYGGGGAGRAEKSNVSAADAMAYLAYVNEDKSSIGVSSLGAARSLNNTSVRKAYEAVMKQVALAMSGDADETGAAEAEFRSFLAEETASDDSSFDAKMLTKIAADLYHKDEKGAVKKVTSDDRLNALRLLHTSGGGFPPALVTAAKGFVFVLTERKAGQQFILRKTGTANGVPKAPKYTYYAMEDGKKVKHADEAMIKSENELYYEDPRAFKSKNVHAGDVVIRGARGGGERAEDGDFERAKIFLKEKSMPESVIGKLSHKEAKATAANLGWSG